MSGTGRDQLQAAILGCAAVCLAVGSLQAQTVLRVDASSTSSAPNGSSWQKAFRTVDAALAAVPAGKPAQIWVAASATPYRPSADGLDDPRAASFRLKKNAAVYGGFLGLAEGGNETRLDQRDPTAHVTTLSGDLSGNDTGTLDDPSRDENCYHVVQDTNLSDTVILDGFTVTGGNANGTLGDQPYGGGIYLYDSNARIINCRCVFNRTAGRTHNCGAGVYVSGGAPSLEGCEFADNEADLGGGVASTWQSSASITGCTFTHNTSRYTSTTYLYGGGGMFCSSSSPKISHCTFAANTAMNGGGGLMVYGETSPSISACIFTENSAAIGGGLLNDYAASRITDCQFLSNSAQSGDGGGILSVAAEAEFNNCLFRGNSATSSGGGVSLSWCDDTWNNCTFIGNAASWGGAVDGYYASSTFNKCTFSSNDATDSGGAIYASYVNSFPITARQCVFGENAAGYGGAVYSTSAPTQLLNCVFSGNLSTYWGGSCAYLCANGLAAGCAFVGNSGSFGGAIFNRQCQPRIANCSFSQNIASSVGSAIYNYICNSTTTNCVLWDNRSFSTMLDTEAIYNSSSTPTVTYSCIQDSKPGDGTIPFGGASNGNIDTSPQWIAGPTGSWTAAPVFDLEAGTTTFTDSAAQFGPGRLAGRFLRPRNSQYRTGFITANTRTTITVIGDLSALAGQGDSYTVLGLKVLLTSPCADSGNDAAVPSTLVTDLLGRPRISHGRVDMGAYESLPPIPGDFDGDEDVDGTDVSAFAACVSGPEIPLNTACQVKDLDRDGDVDQADFGMIQRCYSGEDNTADPRCAQ